MQDVKMTIFMIEMMCYDSASWFVFVRATVSPPLLSLIVNNQFCWYISIHELVL